MTSEMEAERLQEPTQVEVALEPWGTVVVCTQQQDEG